MMLDNRKKKKTVGRNFDIVRDKSFKSANVIFNGKLKQNIKSAFSRPTQHNTVVNTCTNDLLKIDDYLSTVDNLFILQYRNWCALSNHFVSRGLEIHRQLTTHSRFCMMRKARRRWQFRMKLSK